MESFKKKIENFWDWFNLTTQESARISKAINDKFADNIAAELSNELNKAFNGIPFIAGGKDNEFELTLSPEGDRDKLSLTRYWKEQAPEIKGWNANDIQ